MGPWESVAAKALQRSASHSSSSTGRPPALRAEGAALQPCGIEYLMEFRDFAVTVVQKSTLVSSVSRPLARGASACRPGRLRGPVGGPVDRLEPWDLPLRIELVEMLVYAGMTVPEPGEW